MHLFSHLAVTGIRAGTAGRILGISVLLAGLGQAQTKIDVSMQTKTVDFSSASFTKPIKIGTVIPSACMVGEAFYKTNAVAGNNVYWCTAANTWTQQGAKLAGDYSASQVTNAVDQTQPAVYTAGARQTFSPSATTTGLRLVPSTLPTNPLSGDLAVDAGDSFALKVYNGTQWVTTSSTGGSGGSGGSATVSPGVGIVISGSSNQSIGIDTAVVPSYLARSITIDFGLIGAHSCVEATMTLNGATTGDAIAAGWPASLPVSLTGTMFVSLANVVTVRVCNTSASPVDPPNTDYRALIVRSF